MDKLYQYSALRINGVSTKFKRYLVEVGGKNKLIN